MKSLRTKIAAVVIAAAALVAAPAAANAYTPVAPGQTVDAAPGTPVTIAIDQSSLPAADTSVTFTFSGEGVGAGSLAVIKTAVTSTSVTKPRGSSVTVTIPANGFGDYSLVAVGAVTGTALPAVPIDSGVAAPAAGGPGGGLPATGVDSASLMGVWIGGGVLLLGGLAVTVFAVRRQRQGA